MNPALYEPHQSGVSKALRVIGLPGVICSLALVLFWPFALVWLLHLPWWLGGALALPWWLLLSRYRDVVKLLVCYGMIALAVLGWLLLAIGLYRAGALVVQRYS